MNGDQATARAPTTGRRVATGFIAAFAAWLLSAAALSPFEVFDSWDAISNARAIVGWEQSTFNTIRGTFWSIVFVPVEVLRRAMAWPSSDARPFRLVVALMHSGAVWWMWRRLRALDGADDRARALGFVLAVACPVVALYAPYRSTDLLPGVWLFGMVIIAWRYGQTPARRDLWVIAALGLLGALMKPAGGGLMWLTALAVFAATSRGDVDGGRARRGLELLAVAGAGAVVFWILRGSLIGAMGDDTRPWWQLPWFHMRAQAHDAFVVRGHHFHRIAWLRNLWGYGGAALLLALVGGARSWRERHGVGRALVVGWVVFLGLSFTNAIAEIRYLGPAIPLTAALAARGLMSLRTSPLRLAIAVVAVLDLGIAGWTASGAYAPVTSVDGGAQPLVARLRAVDAPIVVGRGPSFVLERAPPLLGDPYHGVTSVRPSHLALWLDRPMFSLELSTAAVTRTLRDPEGRLLLASALLVHVPSYLSAEQIDDYHLDVARSRAVPAAEHVARRDDGRVDVHGEPQGWMYLLIDLPDGTAIPLAPHPQGGWLPRGQLPPTLEGATLRGGALLFSCDASGRCAP